eukprot:392028_1
MGILTIFLDKATNLKDKDTVGESDPYVKFELEQDNVMFDKDFGEQKSTTKSGELNPVYGETFHFNIPTLENVELKVKVMDDDVVSDDKIGKCTIKLENLQLSETPVRIVEKVHNRVFGEDSYVHLDLSYTE